MTKRYLKAILVAILILSSSNMYSKRHSIWKNRKYKTAQSKVKGFGILYRLPGQWNGPVTSDTPAGNFPKWYVDFRPVSSSQISQFSVVNPSMCNYLTFFVVKHNNRLKVAMRTDAVFRKKGCITYEVMTEVNEQKGYYKFSDFQSGVRRAYTVFRFKKNSIVMKVYTNKFNRQKYLTLHSTWKAKRYSFASSIPSIKRLSYPQPRVVKDFSRVFGNAHESIYFSRRKDPYRYSNEVGVGKITFNISIAKKFKVKNTDELFLMLTTKPIFKGYKYLPYRLNYISKFIYLPANTKRYVMTHVHPGVYYLYSYNDVDNDKLHKSGDYMSSKWVHKITVLPGQNRYVNTYIDFKIP